MRSGRPSERRPEPGLGLVASPEPWPRSGGLLAGSWRRLGPGLGPGRAPLRRGLGLRLRGLRGLRLSSSGSRGGHSLWARPPQPSAEPVQAAVRSQPGWGGKAAAPPPPRPLGEASRAPNAPLRVSASLLSPSESPSVPRLCLRIRIPPCYFLVPPPEASRSAFWNFSSLSNRNNNVCCLFARHCSRLFM